MTDILAAAALCAALGFALGYAHPGALGPGLAILVFTAVMGSFAPHTDLVSLACWISVIATAASVHLPAGVGRPLALVLAANAGVWSGAVVGLDRTGLLAAMPFALISLPSAWLVANRKQIAVKVVASWLVAVAVLAAGLPILSTPASAPDHME